LAALRRAGAGRDTIVVVSHREQCADPIFFEMMGLDLSARPAIPLDDGVAWHSP
jgi:hypothetical protein